jgi:transposase InsO family protein
VSRSGYYKAVERADRRLLDGQLILSMVHDIRRRHPRIGGKKLYSLLKADLFSAGIKVGRDKFFELLAKNGMLVKKRRKCAYTTDSYHHFRVYKNLLKHQPPQRAHQGWVSDITYVRQGKDFRYLFLVTDCFSRKIIGWNLSESLAIPGAVSALKMAIRQCPDTAGVIHHSDRGIQYCSKGYTDLLRNAGIRISMTEENHCYENAIAERVNGILKQEYGLDETFASVQLLSNAVKEAIWSYNMERPHWSLNLATPEQMHQAA